MNSAFHNFISTDKIFFKVYNKVTSMASIDASSIISGDDFMNFLEFFLLEYLFVKFSFLL